MQKIILLIKDFILKTSKKNKKNELVWGNAQLPTTIKFRVGIWEKNGITKIIHETYEFDQNKGIYWNFINREDRKLLKREEFDLKDFFKNQ